MSCSMTLQSNSCEARTNDPSIICYHQPINVKSYLIFFMFLICLKGLPFIVVWLMLFSLIFADV